ncbi:PREDICTED: deleted in azoospermia protein 4-like, partial [Rhinopithecus bieti]|uniref:deleted in azoospermia protein 4-like n=1 Tax=Rhinopithecus bieti TaxID=61621 RepID=UPI00083C46BA
MPAANPATPNSTISRETSTQSSSAAASQGYVVPEGRIMPNTVFVGGIDDKMAEAEIKSFFGRYGSVKEVKIITDQTGVSKGYGFVSFFNDVDVQKIVESQVHIQGKKLKLGPAIRKQNLCAYHVQPRRLVFNPPPPPQFRNVWSNPNAETYRQPRVTLNPITQYVQPYPSYPNSPGHGIIGYQLPVYNYQAYPTYPDSPGQVITGYHLPVYNYQSATNPVTPNTVISRETNTQSSSAATSQGCVLPEGRIMPNTVFVGGIDDRMDETEIAHPTYRNSPCQVITGYQLPVYNYQMPPQWPVGEPRSYAVPL